MELVDILKKFPCNNSSNTTNSFPLEKTLNNVHEGFNTADHLSVPALSDNSTRCNSYTLDNSNTIFDEPNSMAPTPPCLYNMNEITADVSTSILEYSQKKNGETNIAQNKCCSCNENVCQNVSDNAPSSTTIEIELKQYSKLNDLKVQELKFECKKRQLPVSGSKNQILERLKPYEEAILAEISARTTPTFTSTAKSDLNFSKNSQNVAKVSVPNSTIDMSVIEAVASNKSNNGTNNTTTVDMHLNSTPIRDVINDYLLQNQSCSEKKLPPLILKKQSQQQQRLAINNDNESGGYEEHQRVMHNPQHIAHNQSIMNSEGLNPNYKNNKKLISTAPKECQSQIQQKQNFCRCCNFQQDIPQKFNPTSPGFSSSSDPLKTHPEPFLQHQQKLVESTFSFAQLGSGGQFTLAESESSNDPNNASTETRNLIPEQNSNVSEFQNEPSNFIEFDSSNSYKSYELPLNSSCSCCRQDPLQNNSNSQKNFKSYNSTNQSTTNFDSSNQYSINENTISSGINRRHSALNNPVEQQDFLSGSHKIPLAASYNGCTCEEEPPMPLQFDPSDPDSLLTASTLANHEELLRYQQKKIYDIQRNLNKSQQHLREQQRMIWIAKKAKVCRDESGRPQSMTDFCLNQLDVKNFRSLFMQNILHHKMQQQQFQTQIVNHKQLICTEKRLQEQLHIDQAVEDIVRIIKQDPRASLLIVQLLRRYQLEKSDCFEAAKTIPITNPTQPINENRPQDFEFHDNSKFHNNDQNSKTYLNPTNSCCSSSNYECDSYNNNSPMCRKMNGSQCCAVKKSNGETPLVVIDDSNDEAPQNCSQEEMIQNSVKSIFKSAKARKKLNNNNKQQNRANEARKRNSSLISSSKSPINANNSSFKNNTLTKKINTSKRPTGANSSKNAQLLASSNSVDMEEIFRSVLEDASKATTAKNNENFNNSKPNGNNESSKCSVFPRKSVKSSTNTNKSQINTNNIKTTKNQKSLAISKCTTPVNSLSYNEEVSDPLSDSSTEFQNFFENEVFGQTEDFEKSPISNNNCSETFKQDNKNYKNSSESVINSTSLDINCFNKNDFNEHVCFNSYLKTGVSFDYTKNYAFDDLMDILKDDQEKSNHGYSMDLDKSSKDLGYTTELINFLANDNNNEFPHDSNNSDFQQNFDFTPTNGFDEGPISNYNSLNTPNSMLYSSSDNPISNQNLYANQQNFHNSLGAPPNTSYLLNNNSMDIPPPSSNDNQLNRCDDGFSSLSVDSTISSSSVGACFLMNHQNSSFNSDPFSSKDFEQQKTSLMDKEFCNSRNMEDMDWLDDDNVNSFLFQNDSMDQQNDFHDTHFSASLAHQMDTFV